MSNSTIQFGVSGIRLLTICLVLFFGFTVNAQDTDDKKPTDKKEAASEPQSSEEAEFQRRMDSITKSIEKEDRPDLSLIHI